MATQVIKWRARDKSEHNSEFEADLKDMKDTLIEKISDQDCVTYGNVSVEEIADIILENSEDVLALINFYKGIKKK